MKGEANLRGLLGVLAALAFAYLVATEAAKLWFFRSALVQGQGARQGRGVGIAPCRSGGGLSG